MSKRDERRRRARALLVWDLLRVVSAAHLDWPITSDDTDAEADLCDAFERWQVDMGEPSKALKRRGLA